MTPTSPWSLPAKGQFVRIRSSILNRHVGEMGVVVDVKLSKRGGCALEKYVVQFADNDQDEFWGIQLEVELYA